MTNKLKSYDLATVKLVGQAAAIDVNVEMKYDLPTIVYALRETFKQRLTYRKVFCEIRQGSQVPSTGFCLVSSYYLLYKMGMPKEWQITRNPVHWWLEDERSTEILDITYDQFPFKFPYHLKELEPRIAQDPEFTKSLFERAMILGKCAGLE